MLERLSSCFTCFNMGGAESKPPMHEVHTRGGKREANVTVLDGSRLCLLVANDEEFGALSHDLFNKYDTDKDGQLTKKEIKEAILGMRNDLGLPPPETKDAEHNILEEAFNEIDSDHNGIVDGHEFKVFLKKTLTQIAANLKAHPITVAILDGALLRKMVEDAKEFGKIVDELYSEADKNKDGTLSKAEVKPTVLGLATMLGIPPTGSSEEAEELVNCAFEEIDRDGSGNIQKEEFEALIRGALLTVADRLAENPITIIVQE